MRHKSRDILETALRLFEQNGFHAVGIDRIIAESGVAKMTMYKHFESKDDLIIAVLREYDRRVMRSLLAFVERRRTLRNRIKAVFTWHDEWFRSETFNGSLFINVAAEYHDRDTAIRRIGIEHLRNMEDYIASLFAEPEAGRSTAAQIMLLLAGATALAYTANQRDASMNAWKIIDPMLPQEKSQDED